MSLLLTPAVLERVAEIAAETGVLRLAAVDLDDPGFEPAREALAEFLDAGMAGEMGFLERTRQVRGRPESMLEGAASVLVGVVPYGGEAGPIARYAQHADYHTVIHRRLNVVGEALARLLPGVQSLVCVDTKPVLERAAAALGGLGFLGKNGCLITPGFGSYVLIGCLLTTARWQPDQPAAPARLWDACGSCRACLDACPTDAFDAPGRLDPRRCISYLTIEHRGAIDAGLADRMGERVAGCDVCQEVCPHNHGQARKERIGEAVQLGPPPGPPRVADLVRLATIGNNQHRGFVKHTPLNRIPRRSLRRNALLALGNREGSLSREEAIAAREMCEDADELVASAARRVLERRD